MSTEGERVPSRRVRLAGRVVSVTAARAPWLWPLLRPGVEGFFDHRATSWDSRVDAGTPSHLIGLATAVGRLQTPPERILEIGCGTGEASLFLAREYPAASIRGVDISPEMVRRATRKIGLDPGARVVFKVADAARLPFPTGSFDLVVMLNMPVFFDEVARVSRDDGRIVVSSSLGSDTPFHTSLPTLIRGFARRGLGLIESGEPERAFWALFGR